MLTRWGNNEYIKTHKPLYFNDLTIYSLSVGCRRVNSNIIYSALLSPKGNIAMLFKGKSKTQFIAPAFMYEEINTYIPEIAKARKVSIAQIINEFKNIISSIKFYDLSTIDKKTRNKAREIVKGIDADDVMFIALHLQTKHKLWTGDKILIKGLLAKGYDICITTTQLKKKLSIK